MKTKFFLFTGICIVFIFCLVLNACSDASKAKMYGYGNKFKVEVISCGKVFRTYVSTGKVLSEKDSDGYYFMDSKTGKLVEIAGEVIITQLD
jgi:hypothetical protein